MARGVRIHGLRTRKVDNYTFGGVFCRLLKNGTDEFEWVLWGLTLCWTLV